LGENDNEDEEGADKGGEGGVEGIAYFDFVASEELAEDEDDGKPNCEENENGEDALGFGHGLGEAARGEGGDEEESGFHAAADIASF